MKYQALRPHFFSMVGWGWWGGWWCGGDVWGRCGEVGGGGVGVVGWGWSNLILWTGMENKYFFLVQIVVEWVPTHRTYPKCLSVTIHIVWMVHGVGGGCDWVVGGFIEWVGGGVGG